MSNIQRNFDKALSLYQAKGAFLPPKISWKLDLILYMIPGNIPNKDFLSLQQLMEYEDLQNLNNQSLKIVFNNIIETLFSKQSVQINKCQVKKKGFFAHWVNASIHHEKSCFLLAFSNKTYTYEKSDCQIRKNKQSKRSLDLYYKESFKYTLKFESQQEMKSIWHAYQKEIIDTKTQKNYQQMQTLIIHDQTSKYMQKISLFQMSPSNTSCSPERRSFSPQSKSSYSFKNQLSVSKDFIKLPSKKNGDNENFQLKPVPHDFLCRLKGERSIIALSKDDEARIYIQHVFSCKLQQKRLLSFLLLQKSWNSFLVMQQIQKSELPNEVVLSRKYDSFKELGQFAQVNLKATYSAWSSNMSMVTIQSLDNPDKESSLECNSVITLESDNNKVRILVEEQLTSKKHSNEKLRKVLLEMYRQIIKLELIHQKIVFKDFQAQTIITNMLEDEESTNTQSQEDIEYLQSKSESFERDQIRQQTEQILQKTLPILKQTTHESIIRLKSPVQFPNPEYIKLIKKSLFQKTYFKFNFSQQILTEYDKYAPYYRLDKMIQNKIYEITPNRELKFIDQELLDSQKETLRSVLRQIGANIISGKSILNVSLPVDIFQSRTGLERISSSFACSPDYLIPRAQSTVLEQIKYVTGFIINVVSCELVMQKPFNPILGQTFQGYIKGIPIYCEQICHNPPVSAYFIKCPQFTLYGNLIPFADVGLNTGVGGNLGPMNIVFTNGSHFECYFPPSEISGLIYGERKFRCYNKGLIFEKNSRLYSEFSIQNQKKGVYEAPQKLKGGQIIGGIYLVKKEFIDEIERYRGQHKNLKKFYGLTKEMIVQKHHSITGEWFSNIIVDNQVINENITVYPVQYAKNILPSDSNHRLDVLYHKMKDLTHSQKQKQILEIRQRSDKKLRQKHGPK